MSTASAIKQESVWSYPRPPALESTPRHLEIKWRSATGKDDVVLASTTNAFRVLETSHPPTYYIPPGDVNMALLTKNTRHSFCEWKGNASYYDVSADGQTVKSRVWTYETPSKRFTDIKDYLSFYAGPWTCYVDGEEVKAQPGDFYGGWMTSDIDGGPRGVKGGPGKSIYTYEAGQDGLNFSFLGTFGW
ncbi:MAG: hypothetical protein CYPHOPRED_001047 [Cyphobasidiales sp. Tagirdzhanova-0007]|nr:MAG: hypothetical protein CYPHOPRED_001047 [Cyphobasidiales sp. Tagirdzhanova-0007]